MQTDNIRYFLFGNNEAAFQYTTYDVETFIEWCKWNDNWNIYWYDDSIDYPESLLEEFKGWSEFYLIDKELWGKLYKIKNPS